MKASTYGDPRKLKIVLDICAKVIAAHCASSSVEDVISDGGHSEAMLDAEDGWR